MKASVITLAAAVFASAAFAGSGGKAIVTAAPEVKWTGAGVPGVSIAGVDGDMKKGPSHFFLKYASGFKTPPHFHTPDHHVVTVSGTLVLVVGDKEHTLAPGSYFSLKGKAPHAARCEGAQDCVMFIHARGPWDVVPIDK